MQGASTLAGVELGQFITRTHMGRVFRGVYNGEPVTVKVPMTFPLLLVVFLLDPCILCLGCCMAGLLPCWLEYTFTVWHTKEDCVWTCAAGKQSLGCVCGKCSAGVPRCQHWSGSSCGLVGYLGRALQMLLLYWLLHQCLTLYCGVTIFDYMHYAQGIRLCTLCIRIYL